jgi:RNA 2',3'-cyclic 3'-phosphodiesterase
VPVLRLFVAVRPPIESARRLLARLSNQGDIANADASEATSAAAATTEPSETARRADARPGLPIPRYRPTPEDQVHLTVQFIGDTDARQLPEVRESVERSASGIARFTLTPLRTVTLPRQGPARLIACETDLPANLAELHRRLAHRLARNLKERTRESFLPHLTLARFASPAGGVRIDEAIEAPGGADDATGAFLIDHVSLMSSQLRPDGAIHREMARFDLERA